MIENAVLLVNWFVEAHTKDVGSVCDTMTAPGVGGVGNCRFSLESVV